MFKNRYMRLWGVLLFTLLAFMPITTASAFTAGNRTPEDWTKVQSLVELGVAAPNPLTAPWRYKSGPPLLAAALHTVEGRADTSAYLSSIAVGQMRAQVLAGQSTQWVGTDGDITSMFFGVNLGLATILLRKSSNLNPETDALFTDTMVSISKTWVAHGNPTWYTNGNIDLGESLLYALTWKLTGDSYWKQMYEFAFAFAEHPDPRKYLGLGLVKTSTTAGYLVEQGAYGTGFDTDYTTVQASLCARLWLITHDDDALELLRLLWGTLAPLTNAQGMIDISVGVRHPHPGEKWTLATSIVPVLASTPNPPQSVLDQLPIWWTHALNGYYQEISGGPNSLSWLGDLSVALLADAGWTY